MPKIAIYCVPDGFSGPKKLNKRTVEVIQKAADLFLELNHKGNYVEVWIPKSNVPYPSHINQIPDESQKLYNLMFWELMKTNKVIYTNVQVAKEYSYNALSDGLSLANLAAQRPMNEYMVIVPNFATYFKLTYKTMRKYLGDGKKWTNFSVQSVGKTPRLKACLLYWCLILITALASINKKLWLMWYEIRSKEKEKREKGFVATVGDQ